MESNFCRNFHIYLSLFLFISCFLFPAFYIHETRESVYPGGLLANGWLGPIEGYFSWYANPLYVLAICFYRHKLSLVSALFALILSLSFLTQKNVLTSALPAYAEITSYGIGYFLWVTSMGVLFVGQFVSLAGGSVKQSTFLILAVLIGFSGMFIRHFVFTENSQYKVIQARNLVFSSQCKKSVTKINSTVENIEGIFFDPDFEIRFRKEGLNNWRIDGVGGAALGQLNSGNIKYYEILNDGNRPDHATNKYVRYYLNDHNGVPVDTIGSEILVKSTSHEFNKSVNIRSGTISIFDRRDNRLLAKSTYTFDPEKGSLCSDGIIDSTYSSHYLLRAVLNFDRKYPSIYPK